MEGGEGNKTKEILEPRFEIKLVNSAQFEEHQRDGSDFVSSRIINACSQVGTSSDMFIETAALPCMLYFSYNHTTQQGIGGHFIGLMNRTQMEGIRADRQSTHRKALSKIFEITPDQILRATPLKKWFYREFLENDLLHGYKYYQRMLSQLDQWIKQGGFVETYIFGGNVSAFAETKDIRNMEQSRKESIQDFNNVGVTIWDMRPDLRDENNWGVPDNILSIPQERTIYLQRSFY